MQLKVDRAVEKIKVRIIEMFEQVIKQFEAIKALINQNELNKGHKNPYKSKIKKLFKSQFEFLENSMGKILREQMMANDLRKVMVSLNIAQHLTQIAELGEHVGQFLMKNEVRDSGKPIINKTLNAFLKNMKVTENAILSEDHKQMKVIVENNKKFIANNHQIYQTVLASLGPNLSLADNEIYLKLYSQVHYLNRASDILVKIVGGIYYLKSHTIGELYQ